MKFSGIVLLSKIWARGKGRGGGCIYAILECVFLDQFVGSYILGEALDKFSYIIIINHHEQIATLLLSICPRITFLIPTFFVDSTHEKYGHHSHGWLNVATLCE